MHVIKTFIKNITYTLDYVRYWEWYDKVQSIIIAVIVLITYSGVFFNIGFSVVVFVVYLYCAFTFGYIANNYFDKDDDKRVGKESSITLFSLRTARILIIGSGIGTFLLPLWYQSIEIVLINVAAMVMGFAYSAKPLRLKVHGFWGIGAASVAQRLPFAFFYILVPGHPLLVSYLFVWLLLLGLLIEADFQLIDYYDDRVNNIETYAVRIGIKKMIYLIYTLLTTLILWALVPTIVAWSFQGILISILLVIFSANAFHCSFANIAHIRELS